MSLSNRLEKEGKLKLNTDTIAAIATAMTNAGISIIRISGSKSLSIIDKIYCSKNKKKKLSNQPSHTIHYGYIVDGAVTIDEVMILIMKAPNSYTKEDVVEIDCHGGIVVTKKILEIVIKYGARPAEPGEFTKRAFLNGRIDLSQAEAVIDIINAKNEFALKSSINQLKGNVSNAIKEIRSNMIKDIAFIEAALDDPEHIEISGFSDELKTHIKNIKIKLQKLLDSVENSRILKEGIYIVIVGKPNVGKSTLLNTLVGEDRAIVTNIEGTTRDILEETIQLEGITLNIIDTAGIRSTENEVEKIGIEKAKQYADNADLIIYIVDASKQLDKNDYEIIKMIQHKKCIVLLNKTDLFMEVDKKEIERLTNKKVVSISAKEHQGIDLLEEEIKELFYKKELQINDEVYITNIRHKTAIVEAIESLNQVEESIRLSMPEDFYSIDLMNCYESLGRVIGESVGEDLVNTIFSEFCMGK